MTRFTRQDIRPASASDADLLSSLALRSKAYWGYSTEFMEQCRDELNYDAAMIESAEFSFRVALLQGDKIAGFYAIEWQEGRSCELEALFVDPEYIGCGLGKLLMDDACRLAAEKGRQTMIIQGDPHARRFYEAAGGVQIGERESASVAGRSLPLFEVCLRDRNTGAQIQG